MLCPGGSSYQDRRLTTRWSRPGQLRRIGSKMGTKSWPGGSSRRRSAAILVQFTTPAHVNHAVRKPRFHLPTLRLRAKTRRFRAAAGAAFPSGAGPARYLSNANHSEDSLRPKWVGCRTTRWSRPGQPGVEFGAILALAGRAAHLEAVGQQGVGS